LHEIVIYEPCNWVSNMAYYRPVLAICDKTDWKMASPDVSSLAQGFAMLAAGSAFYHASGTRIGMTLDNMPIGLLAYQAHQAMHSALPWSPILHELSPKPRGATAAQISARFVAAINSGTPYTWGEQLKEIVPAPSYFVTFAAMVTTGITLLLPPATVDPLVRVLCKLLLTPFGMQDVSKFLTEQYAPAVQNATVNVTLTRVEKLRLGLQISGVVLKARPCRRTQKRTVVPAVRSL
jgi:hypothetical protein